MWKSVNKQEKYKYYAQTVTTASVLYFFWHFYPEINIHKENCCILY